LGYVEGKNILIEYRSSKGKPDLLPSLVAELVHLKVDVIVTSGATVTRAAKKATSTIPIVLMIAGSVLLSERRQVADLAVKSRLPAIYYDPQFVEAGGLMTYGVSFTDLDRRAATYVDKILKGAKPADLPVEQPTKFELVINLKTAKQIGLTILPNLLARADRVIR
jgi:putative ABC transport system substrate-binding protein